jgi:membrane carboxypeptidase/penicillin-binding protein PbpC
MHKEIEDALAKEADRFKRYRATNAASVAIDSRNGEILSMVGSLDFYSKKIDGQTNIVLSRRQPGSTAKPFAYASLISQGYSPETLV